MMNLNQLPEEILLRIFSYLPLHSIIYQVSKTCQLWRELSFQNHLWKKIDVHAELENSLTEEHFLKILKLVADYVEELHFGKLENTCISFNTRAFYVHDGIQCKNLKVLHFRGTSVDQEILQTLCRKYPNIAKIVVDDNIQIDMGGIMPALENLKALKSLSISDIYSGEQADIVEERLWNTRLDDLCQGFPDLECLDVSSEYLKNTTLKSILFHCRNLKILNLDGCMQISGSAFKSLTNNTKITHLNLGCTLINDDGIKEIAMSSPCLLSISVEGCKYVSDVAISHLTAHCKELERVVISAEKFPSYLSMEEAGCNVTNGGLQLLALGCPNLKELLITCCQQVKDEGIIVIAENCRNFTTLNVSGCLSITDQSVLALARNDSVLEHLDLSECSHITEVGINQLILKCSRLKHLDCSSCLYVSKIRLTEFDSMEHPMARHLLQLQSPESIYMETDVQNGDKTKVTTGHSSETVSVHPFAVVSSVEKDLETTESSQSRCDRVKGNGAQDAGQVRHVQPMHDLSSMPLVRRHSFLQRIGLNFCSKLDDESIAQIAMYCPELRSLEINGCCNVTDRSIEKIAKHCKLLQNLDISNTSVVQGTKITDRSLTALAAHCKCLQRVSLEKNYLITCDGLKVLLHDSVSLRIVTLMVSTSSGITLEAIKEITSPDVLTTKRVQIDNTTPLQGKMYVTIRLFLPGDYELLEKDLPESYIRS